MQNNRLIHLIDSASEILDLQKSIIEKDYYVTQVINSISDIENDYFNLIFCGGTCLSKAHKIVKRMSEDVDFKIHAKNSTTDLSKNKLSNELKKFRQLIKSALDSNGLTITNTATRNEGNYLKLN